MIPPPAGPPNIASFVSGHGAHVESAAPVPPYASGVPVGPISGLDGALPGLNGATTGTYGVANSNPATYPLCPGQAPTHVPSVPG